MSQIFTKSTGGGGSGIETINNIGPDGTGNFTLESTDGSVTFTGVSNGLNLSAIGKAQTYVFVDPQSGNDTTGNGSAIAPFATITFATSSISDNSATKPYVLLLNGIFSEAIIVLKPFISWNGLSQSTQISVTGAGNNITADASWVSQESFGIIQNVTLANSTNIDFTLTGITSGATTLTLNNIIVSGTVNCTGRIAAEDTFLLTNAMVSGAITIQDAQGSSLSCIFDGGFNVQSISAVNPITWVSNCDRSPGDISVVQTSGHPLELVISNASIQGTVTVNGTAFVYDPVSYPTGGFIFSNGGVAQPYTFASPNLIPNTPINGTYTTLLSDYLILCNSGSAFNLTLNTNAGLGQLYIIKDISGNAAINNITLLPGTGTIDNSASFVINSNYGSVKVYFDGSNWWLL